MGYAQMSSNSLYLLGKENTIQGPLDTERYFLPKEAKKIKDTRKRKDILKSEGKYKAKKKKIFRQADKINGVGKNKARYGIRVSTGM